MNLTPPSSHSVYVDELVFSYGLKLFIPGTSSVWDSIPVQVSKQCIFSCQDKTYRTLELTQFALLSVCVRATEWFKTLRSFYGVVVFTYSAKEHTLRETCVR